MVDVIKKAVGIPKFKAISNGKLWLWAKKSPPVLILNNTGNEEEPHPVRGFWEIKFKAEFQIWTLIKYAKFSNPKLLNWWKIISGTNFWVNSTRKLFGENPRPIKTGVIHNINKGINHFKHLKPSTNKVDRTNPSQAFLEKVKIVQIRVETKKIKAINLPLGLKKFSFKKIKENGHIIFSHIPK